jgi:CheY-like chemotaxis protein
MNNTHIPIYYYPTTVTFVDDSKRFLKNLTLQLDENLAYILLDNPVDAVEHTRKFGPDAWLEDNYLVTNADSHGQEHIVTFNTKNVHERLYNSERFCEICVISVDYMMPQLNGQQLSELLKDSPIKKLMVTGEATETLAIELLNKKIIDRLVYKDNSDDLCTALETAIRELQYLSFQERTAGIAKTLSTEPTYCLDDPAFIKLFHEICNKYNVVEYTLLEPSGSYLLLDAEANLIWFIVKNSEELAMYAEIAKDSNVSEKTVNQILCGERIPYFYCPEDSYNLTGEGWEKYLYAAEPLKGRQKYHYAIIDTDVTGADIDRKKIFSYQKFLSNE